MWGWMSELDMHLYRYMRLKNRLSSKGTEAVPTQRTAHRSSLTSVLFMILPFSSLALSLTAASEVSCGIATNPVVDWRQHGQQQFSELFLPFKTHQTLFKNNENGRNISRSWQFGMIWKMILLFGKSWECSRVKTKQPDNCLEFVPIIAFIDFSSQMHRRANSFLDSPTKVFLDIRYVGYFAACVLQHTICQFGFGSNS